MKQIVIILDRFDIVSLSQIFRMSEQGLIDFLQDHRRIDSIVCPHDVFIDIANDRIPRGPSHFPYGTLDEAYHRIIPCLYMLQRFGQFAVFPTQRFGLIQWMIAPFLESFTDAKG
ncbi:hypothetical protein D1872_236030 [compost metagenome]